MNEPITQADPALYNDSWIPEAMRQQMPPSPFRKPTGPQDYRAYEPPSQFTSIPQPVPQEVMAPPRPPEVPVAHHDMERRKAAYAHAKEVLHDRHFEDNGLRVQAEMDLARFFLGE